jgi:hypothetical protein
MKQIKDIKSGNLLSMTTTPNVGLVLRNKIPKPKISRAMLKKAILSCDMPTQSSIARALNCNYMTAKKYLDKYEMHSLMDKRRLEAVDTVEDKLLEIAKEGNIKAIETFLAANSERYSKKNAPSTADVAVKIVFDTPNDN